MFNNSHFALKPIRIFACVLTFSSFSFRLMSSSALATEVLWSDSAIQLAKEQSISQRKKLLAEAGVLISDTKDIRVIAKKYDPNSADTNTGTRIPCDIQSDSKNEILAVKVVHFQRHGQGYHNLLGDVLRAAGAKPSVDSMDPAINPWLRPEIVDSPLTEAGKEECRKQRLYASTLNPQVVITSPLMRAIQTGQISFQHVYGDPRIPWVAHEGCREETGVLVCNKRRPLSLIKEDYPNIEFLGDMTEEDSMFHPTKRESNISKSDRIYDFLIDCIAKRAESEIAVISHSATLFHMCNAVLDCQGDLDLMTWFLTSEIRSMTLTFMKNKL